MDDHCSCYPDFDLSGRNQNRNWKIGKFLSWMSSYWDAITSVPCPYYRLVKFFWLWIKQVHHPKFWDKIGWSDRMRGRYGQKILNSSTNDQVTKLNFKKITVPIRKWKHRWFYRALARILCFPCWRISESNIG